MLTSKIILDRHFNVGKIDKRIFGSFAEHLGRCIYGGIYEPGHPAADEQGFRKDVMQLVKELGVSIVRYPGGNFVSGHDWRDSIGPKASRPARAEQAWFSIESNQFGLDEAMDWCKKTGVDPMIAVNLGTLGPNEPAMQVEYCNTPGGTFWSDQRKKNGSADPHNVKPWCLGNEMDGPWQICHRTADEYGRLANETAKMMKWQDPSIEVVACGSSHQGMPTFAAWESTVLDHAYDNVDYISLHQYYGNPAGDFGSFLAEGVGMDRFIKDVITTCDFVKAKKRGRKDIMLSFDEWNVLYHTLESDKQVPRWQHAPCLLEDVYDVADALVVGTMLNALMRHADRVKIACQAQPVNVIAPIMTRTGGPAWKQTIFYPFFHMAKYGRGTSLGTLVESATYNARNHQDVPYLDLSAVHNEEAGEVTIFAVNRSKDEPMQISTDLRGIGDLKLLEQITIRHDDIGAVNTECLPDKFIPVNVAGGIVEDGHFTGTLPAASWNVIRFKSRARLQ